MTDTDEQILKQKKPLMKIAKIFFLVWLVAVLLPSTCYFFKNANHIQKYGVVFAVSKVNGLLEDQCNSLANKALDKINLDKYTSKISIPTIDFEKELKLDTVSNASKQTENAKKATSALSKLGIKQLDGVDKNLDSVQKQIDSANEKLKGSAQKLNAQIENATKQIKSTLSTDLKAGLKTELSAFAGSQVQNQLNLDDKLYTALKENKFGINCSNTTAIYNALKSGGIFKQAVTNIDNYAGWIKTILGVVLVILLLLPPVILFIVAKKLSATFTVCPYCNKTFVTKANATSILSLIKFW